MDAKGIDVPHGKLPVYPSSLPPEARERLRGGIGPTEPEKPAQATTGGPQRDLDVKINTESQEPFKIEVSDTSDDNFFKINKPKLENVLKDVHRDMTVARYSAAARTGAIHEGIVKRVDIMYNTGSITLDKAIEMACQEAALAGINSVIYKNGNQVNFAAYVEMALRTSSRRAALTAEGAKRNDWEIYTVISPTLHSTCSSCQIWQGRVLIDDVYADGKPDGKHWMLSDAISGKSHFLGPNCRHPLVTYFEGVTQVPTSSPLDKTESNYRAEQEQRHIERMIRHWKRREAIAQTREAKVDASASVKQWQQKMREHLEGHQQLHRKPVREKLLGLTDDEKKHGNIRFVGKRLSGHFEKHAEEYAGITIEQYQQRAIELAADNNALTYRRSNGDIIKYDPISNDFLVCDKNESIKTMFKPQQGREYYEQDRGKWND